MENDVKISESVAAQHMPPDVAAAALAAVPVPTAVAVQPPAPTADAVSVSTPACAECAAHDAETKRMVGELFSTDEVTIMLVILANAIRMQQMAAKALKPQDVRKAKARMEADFVAQAMGKLVVSLDKEYLAGLNESLKSSGIMLAINHQNCPHTKAP